MANKIVCNNYTFTGDDITAADCFIGNSLVGDELSVDTLEATLVIKPAPFMSSDGSDFQVNDGSALFCTNSGYQYGDVVTLEHDNSLIGKFYFEKSERISRDVYEFFCMSAIGILGNLPHYGGIYTETTAGAIIADIMGDIPYTIYADVSSVFMSGWLPVASRRANLQQVLFAIGAGVFKDSSGNIVIRYVVSSTPTVISDSRIYMDGSVSNQKPCTRVDVTEHSYFAFSSDKTSTLFDTTTSVKSQIVIFDKPCHDLAATGLTIEESGVNYAIVTGIGTLTGKEYTHTQNILSYDTGVSGAPNAVSVTNATLVSTFNSYNVALRVAQYYSAVSINSIGLVVDNERPATEVSFTDTFGDAVLGYIKSMSISLSNTLRADTEIAIGFLPTGHGNNYDNYVLLSGSGNYTVPADVTRIHIILVSAGNGAIYGSGGSDGAVNTGGDGGVGGNGGIGGLIYSADISVEAGQNISFACGVGGAGAPLNGSPGTGTPTTFGTYSSANGVAFSSGFVESKTGLILAANGTTGITGGKGNDYASTSPDVTFDDNAWHPGTNGNYVFGNNGVSWGGGGGGAAVGNNGDNGADALLVSSTSYPGNGGNGANAIARNAATNYGSGGNGGHGGGGGGYGVNPAGSTFGHPGYGGSGGAGGAGGVGCIIIYY